MVVTESPGTIDADGGCVRRLFGQPQTTEPLIGKTVVALFFQSPFRTDRIPYRHGTGPPAQRRPPGIFAVQRCAQFVYEGKADAAVDLSLQMIFRCHLFQNDHFHSLLFFLSFPQHPYFSFPCVLCFSLVYLFNVRLLFLPCLGKKLPVDGLCQRDEGCPDWDSPF